ncbi:hypothetical protein KP79_PYT00833 [Mizuhopecten yessoensis]|uniref:Uncharacterized protein n=1 Tax=Mizuhopecten yessoensis TaxID=6573 RepID=A0A210QPY0_MIZYE|nr:hypothetical protein KP79_PYT00833 [Mizuhopecten yessoensis]
MDSGDSSDDYQRHRQRSRSPQRHKLKSDGSHSLLNSPEVLKITNGRTVGSKNGFSIVWWVMRWSTPIHSRALLGSQN